MAFALAASVTVLLPARWRGLAWVLAALVGVARIHVAAHWPADVLGGAALGTAIGTTAMLALHPGPRPHRPAAEPGARHR
jgi:membrane-associated phospholipid phosphatase